MNLKRMWLATGLLAGAAVAAIGAEVDEDGGHLKITKPAQLSNAVVSNIYQDLIDRMVEGYALSDHPIAAGYTQWSSYNTAPYLSATHGNRFVNNYANETASAYGTMKAGDVLPVGSVLAKDSFTVTGARKVFPGALFVMQKLAGGTSPDTADWRYVMIMPDGSLFGDSMGDGAAEMKFCHDCHKIKKNIDYVFGVPKAFRTGG